MSDREVIAIVMIGCGNFLRRYHLPAIDRDPGLRVIAVFDPSPAEEAKALAGRTGAALVDRLEALPRAAGAMAIVTTPHTLHAGHVGFALERDWHVLCDKPFVTSSADARELATRARARSLVNAVAFNRRLDRGCLRARDAIRAGAIGEVRFVQAVQLGYETSGWFLDPKLGGGGPYTGRASHMADLIPWLLDRRPTRLRSRLRGDGGKRTDRGGFIELQFGELECHFTCIEEGWHMWDELRVFGETGLIELRRPLTQPIGWKFRLSTQRGGASERLDFDSKPGGATEDFISALRGKGSVACSFAEAVTSVEIVEQAFASARSNNAWMELSR